MSGKNRLPYYKRYPRDFIEGTIGMTLELKGAYSLVLDLIYMQSGKLPDDARYISGLLGCSIRKWKSIRSELVQLDKVYVSGEFLSSYRADKELETLSKHQEKQAENRTNPNKNKDLPTPKNNHSRDYPEPEPIEESKTKVLPKKNLGCRIPDGFIPDIQWAVQNGLEQSLAKTEADQFRDFWTAKAGAQATKRDWPATWRTWVRNSIKRLPTSRAPPPRKDTAANAASRRIEELRNAENRTKTCDYQPAIGLISQRA